MNTYLYDKDGAPIDDVLRFGELLQDDEYRRVDQTYIGQDLVSTVWLGIDQSFGTGGAPLIFETMRFTGELAEVQERYSTLAEAVAGHEHYATLWTLDAETNGDQEGGKPE